MKRNKFVRKSIVFSVLCLLLAVNIISCGQVSSTLPPTSSTPTLSGPQYGGILRTSESQQITGGFYPPKMVSPYTMRIIGPALETLLRTDKTGKLIPWLAQSFREDSQTKSITLILNKGIKFHDGADCNAAAVKWNLDQCKAAKQSGTGQINNIEVISDNEVRINLNEWDSTFTSQLAMFTGIIISPETYKKNGEEWCMNNAVGTGPFKMVSWIKDVKITFTKFDNYWQKNKPYLDGIVCTPIIETVTRTMSFKGGELDIMTTSESKDVIELRKAGCNVNFSPSGFSAYCLAFSSANPDSPFANVRVRQAATYAVDTKKINDAIFGGEAEATNQYGNKANWGYNPSIAGYPYNPEKAKQLLTEAGYSNGFKTKLMCLPTNQNVFLAVQNYLKTIGIDADLETIQIPKLETYIMRGATWEGMVQGVISSNVDPIAAIKDRWDGSKGKYVSVLYPDDYLKAIQNAVAAGDFNSKQKWMWEASKLMNDKYCLILPILCVNFYAVAQPYVHDHGICAQPMTTLWTPESAWMDKNK